MGKRKAYKISGQYISEELFTISKIFSKSGDSLHRETFLSLIQAFVCSSGEQIFIRKNEMVMRIIVFICAPYNCRFQMEIIERYGQTRVF